MHTFIALDFETAQPARHTPCAIGLVKVVNGVITQKIFTLIKPPDNEYSLHNVAVHGISALHSEDAPEFPEVYELIKKMINGQMVVCHNAGFDISVLRESMNFHGINGKDISFSFQDTLKLYGNKPLNECCSLCGIDLHHHDALSDAEACARIFMKYHNVDCREFTPGQGKASSQFYNHGKIESDHLKPELQAVADKENMFYNKKVVITGVYQKWPNRNDLAKIIKQMGADIDTGVSDSTQILIAGASAGPKKIEKMLSNIKTDATRRIMNEKDVIEVLSVQS